MAAYPWRYSSSRDVPAPSPLSRDPKIASPTADDGKAVPRMLRNDLITLLGQGSNDPVAVDVGGIARWNCPSFGRGARRFACDPTPGRRAPFDSEGAGHRSATCKPERAEPAEEYTDARVSLILYFAISTREGRNEYPER